MDQELSSMEDLQPYTNVSVAFIAIMAGILAFITSMGNIMVVYLYIKFL